MAVEVSIPQATRPLALGVAVSLITGIGCGGDAEGDRLTNIENLTGSNFNDTLEGNAGNNMTGGRVGRRHRLLRQCHGGREWPGCQGQSIPDLGAEHRQCRQRHVSGFENLIGSQFNDTLTGTSGNNVINGLAGNDRLTGAGGNDTFLFNANFGRDTVTDFAAGPNSVQHDLITFDHALFADFDAVMAATSQVGADTVITVDAENAVTLLNVNMSSLHRDDFAFV